MGRKNRIKRKRKLKKKQISVIKDEKIKELQHEYKKENNISNEEKEIEKEWEVINNIHQLFQSLKLMHIFCVVNQTEEQDRYHKIQDMFKKHELENYYKDYVRTVEINIYNESNVQTKTVKLLDAFPTTIGDISYDWSTSDHATLDVTFAYRYFETDLHYNYSLRKNEK